MIEVIQRAQVIRTEVGRYVEPAIAICKCGCRIELPDPLFNECENCGRWWNASGQEKIDPNSELARELDAEERAFGECADW